MRQRPRPPWREGMALLIVLVLIVMVALSAYSFTLMMQNQYLLSRVQEDQAQAKLAVLSGVDFVAALLIILNSFKQWW